MKKEFKDAQITCRFFALKEGMLEKAGNLVTYAVRKAELEKLTEDNDYKDCLETLQEMLVDPTDDKAVVESLGVLDGNMFILHRGLIDAKKEQIEAIHVTAEDFNALAGTDKAFITLEAHKSMRTITIELDKSDFRKAILQYFADGTTSQVKNLFRSAFQKTLGESGELFYGVKIKKSDISDADIRKALSKAVKDPNRQKTKKKGEEKLKNYDFRISADQKTINSIGSNLFSVLIESRQDTLEIIGGITDNEPEQEQPEQKDQEQKDQKEQEQKPDQKDQKEQEQKPDQKDQKEQEQKPDQKDRRNRNSRKRTTQK